MDNANRNKILAGVFVVLVVVLIVAVYRNMKPEKPAPTAPGYYSGPFRNKKDPNIWGNDDGKRVAPPPGAGAPVQVKAPNKEHID